MHTDGYRSLHNIDISEVVLDKMRLLYAPATAEEADKDDK
jgi:hypothetical protein